jgi:hypothetical protein
MKKNNALSWIATALALVGAALGCGTKTVDIGDDRDPALIGSSLSDYQGIWIGHVELAAWNDGTDAVRLQLDAQGNGVLEVGLGPELEPPVAQDAYPRYFDYMATYSYLIGPITGFSYPIAGAVVESKRIRWATSTAELYREYCDLQTPTFVNEASGYNCTGYSTYSGGGPTCTVSTGEVTDCDWLMCMSACTCDETSCHAWMLDEPHDIRMDAQLESDGEELVGSFQIPDEDTYYESRSLRVVMTRE